MSDRTLTGNIRFRVEPARTGWFRSRPETLVLQVEEIRAVTYDYPYHGSNTDHYANWRDAKTEDLASLGNIGSQLQDERGWNTAGRSDSELRQMLRGEYGSQGLR